MAAALKGVFEESLSEQVKNCKILVVGAGGIGCELLKILVLTGFKTVEVVDLDTIDVSNLNRQFLFRKEHVGRSKAQVARDSVLNFNPDVSITAYHDSVLRNDQIAVHGKPVTVTSSNLCEKYTPCAIIQMIKH